MVQDGLNVKSDLPVKYEEQGVDKMSVNVPAKVKKRQKRQLDETLMFAKYGMKVMRLKASTLAALGLSAEDAGIRAIGHGKVIVASEHSEMAIGKLIDLIEEAQQSTAADKHDRIISLMRLLREFNEQLLHTAQLHLDADKRVSIEPAKPGQVTMAFPAGQPLLVAPMQSNKLTP